MDIGANANQFKIWNITTGDIFTFYGILPEEISDGHSANFEPITVAGRSSQFHSFSGGSSRSSTINFDIHEDYLYDYSVDERNIATLGNKLRALTYPKYASAATIAPRARVRVGNFFQITGICTNCSITWRRPIRDGRYISASVSLEFVESVSKSVDMLQVMSGYDMRVD